MQRSYSIVFHALTSTTCC